MFLFRKRIQIEIFLASLSLRLWHCATKFQGEGGKEEAEMEWRDEEIYYISKLKTTRLEKKISISFLHIHSPPENKI
jgi:hypothetical protein